MKKILFILFCLISVLCCGQYSGSQIKIDSSNKASFKNNSQASVMSSCGSPNGAMHSTTSVPPNYTWLHSKGYCNPGSYGKNGTVCWTFTPTSDSVNVNSGYSSNCFIISFTSSNLYTCSPFCTNVGSGLTFSLTPGTCYTWCFGYSGTGFGCSFSDFCPYFMQTTSVLPIELLYFAGSNQSDLNVLQWETITETNNNYFVLEKSLDAKNWFEITKIKASGNSTINKKYQYFDKVNADGLVYYRLKQVDYNGAYKYFGIIAINSQLSTLQLLRVINLIGETVNEDYKGVVFLFYSNDVVVRKINN